MHTHQHSLLGRYGVLKTAKKAAKYVFYLTNHAYFYVTKCTILHKIDLPSKLTVYYCNFSFSFNFVVTNVIDIIIININTFCNFSIIFLIF